MKLRSIALAGLLSSGVLMTSGCGTSDLTGFVNELLNTAYVTVANGQSAQDFNVGSVGTSAVGEYQTSFFVNTTQDSYTVSHTSEALDPVSFAKGGGHLYGLCAAPNAGSNANVVADSNDGERIKLVNLGLTDIATVSITLTTDTTGDDIGDTNVTASVAAPVCSANHVIGFDSVDPTTVTAVWIDSDGVGGNPPVEIVIPTYDSEVQAVIDQLGANAEFDLVIFDLAAENGTVVPIVPPVE